MTNNQQHRVEAQLAAFALDSFRPGQREVITTILNGQDCLCIMPTGGGKSLCFQLPASVQDGVTLVISPLIALMKDQVDSLRELGMRATLINSTVDADEQNRRMEGMVNGQFHLVYIAPERLRSPRFLEAISQTSVELLAIDEAHCISQWGHDFRPDYARLGEFRTELGNPPTIALTATATPAVREDIVKQLALVDPRVFITGFARPNLHFEVTSAWGNAMKDELLLDFLHDTPGAGIIYTSTRRACDELTEMLGQSIDRSTGMYHAGMEKDDRRKVQESFMRGDHQIVVATNAFGMGIDKADLRFVVHYNIPGSLEAYYQEAGRAGRDGQPSRCLLLFSPRDRYVQEFFIENAYPSRDTVERVYLYLCRLDEDPIEITQQDLKERLSLEIGGEGIGACEQLLARCGGIERLTTQENRASVRIDSDLPSLTDLLPRDARAQRRVLEVIEQIAGGRRDERTYFPLTRLAERAGMKREAVSRALRELRKHDAFDYVPPFRGRAIHVPRRDRPFDDLAIDFKTLEERRANEFEKLERMIEYALTGDCRQLTILEYFGDPAARRCQICDNCGGEPQIEPAETVTEEDQQQLLQCVRIALSGVARVRGRVGKHAVAKMLCGSRSQQIGKLKLDKLSTFGLLSQLKQTEATALLDALIRGNMIQQTETQRMRPVVELTPEGRQVMKGQLRLDHHLPLAAPLRKRLLDLRLPRAGRAAPEPLASELDTADMQTEPGSRSDADRPAGETAGQPDWYWTWRLFSSGFSLAECEQIRQLDCSTIYNHLLAASDAGHPVVLDWILSDSQQTKLKELMTGPAQSWAQQLGNILDPQQLQFWERSHADAEE